MDGLKEKITSVCWMDNGEKLPFTHSVDEGQTVIRCTGFPYGTHTGVRVMRITLG
jgi:hypothetical protein